jgi:hypothetical protein
MTREVEEASDEFQCAATAQAFSRREAVRAEAFERRYGHAYYTADALSRTAHDPKLTPVEALRIPVTQIVLHEDMTDEEMADARPLSFDPSTDFEGFVRYQLESTTQHRLLHDPAETAITVEALKQRNPLE